MDVQDGAMAKTFVGCCEGGVQSNGGLVERLGGVAEGRSTESE